MRVRKLAHLLFEEPDDDKDGEREKRSEESEGEESVSAGHADAGCDPEAGSSCESGDARTAQYDDAGAHESDPGDDGGGDVEWIKCGDTSIALHDHIADDYKKRSAHGDESVGARTGGFVRNSALRAEYDAAEHCRTELQKNADIFS